MIRIRKKFRFFFFFSPISPTVVALFFLVLPPIRRYSHSGRLFSPLPTTARAFVFIARRLPLFLPSLTRIELHLTTLPGALRPILVRSDPSAEKCHFRLEPLSGFLHSRKRAFSTRCFRRSDPTSTSSRMKSSIRLDAAVGFLSLKKCTNPSTHPTTTHARPHTHTSITVSYNNTDVGLAAITAAASRLKSAWHIPSSARQQCASYDGR